jgi:hypothetical protein
LNHVVIKKRVSDVFACVATRATAEATRTVAVQVEAKEVRVAVTTVIVVLAPEDRIEALQNAVLVVEKDALAEKEVQQEAQLVVQQVALVDGNSKRVVPRKRSTNF